MNKKMNLESTLTGLLNMGTTEHKHLYIRNLNIHIKIK